MAQEANGLPYQSENPTGVGAVYFDKTVDPLEAHLDSLKLWNENEQKKQAVKLHQQALTNALVKDVDLNPDGALVQHIPELQQMGQQIHENLAGLIGKYGSDLSSPSAQMEYQKQVAIPMLKYKSMVDASKNAGAQLLNAQTEAYKKDSNADLGHLNSTIAQYRLLGLSDAVGAKGQALLGSMIVPQQGDILGLSQALLKSQASETSQTVKDPVSGAYTTQKVTEVPDAKIPDVAKAAYLGNPDVADAADDYYKKLDPNQQLAYQTTAQDESKKGDRTVAPAEVAYRDYLTALKTKKQEQTGITFTPEQHAFWANYYKDKDDVDGAKYIAETLSQAKNPNSPIWGGSETTQTTTINPQLSGMGIAINPGTQNTEVKTSNALNNLPLGNAVIQITKYKKGVDAQGKQIEIPYTDYKTIPNNRVLGMKQENGKVYIMTDESLTNNLQDPANSKYEEVNDRTIDKLVGGTKDPLKAKAILRKALVEKGYYKNNTPNIPAAGGATTPTTIGGTYIFKGKNGKMLKVDVGENEVDDFLKAHPDAKIK